MTKVSSSPNAVDKVLAEIAKVPRTFVPSDISRSSGIRVGVVENIIQLHPKDIYLGAKGDTEQHYFITEESRKRLLSKAVPH